LDFEARFLECRIWDCGFCEEFSIQDLGCSEGANTSRIVPVVRHWDEHFHRRHRGYLVEMDLNKVVQLSSQDVQ
jgi:hypothetical protein